MSPLRRSLLLASAVMLTLVAIGLAGSSLAQTDPPALGDGDWTVRDTTVIRDWDVIMLRGDLLVTDGGELTLINSTLLFVNAEAGDHGVLVDNGGTLKVLGGATVGSSRPNVPITFVVEAGCTLEIRDSFIEEVGPPSYGVRPKWREIAMYIGTSDAVIENSTFTGGLVGPFFDEGVMAPPVRNCTFENVYGVISYGIGIEDCIFRNQNIFGIVFHGGDTGYVARCTFESVFGTCINVGYEYPELGELYPAGARVVDCTFSQSTRAIKVLDQSSAIITNCSIDNMEREGIVVGTSSSVQIWDGSVNNTFDAIVSAEGSHVEWTVTKEAFVRGGSVVLSGNLTLLEDARLEISDFRHLTLLSYATAPLWFNLHDGSSLVLIRGSVEIPPPTTFPETPAPVRLGPDPSNVGGAIYLEEVDTLNIDDGYHIRSLTAINSTVPIGKVWVEDLYLRDSILVPDPRGSEPQLTVGGFDGSADCWFIDCRLEGIDRIPADGAWLTVLTCDVRSYDFLYDLREMIDEGAITTLGSPAGPPDINVWWSGQVHVEWQNHLPIAGVDVEVKTQSSNEYHGTTDDHGDSEMMALLTEALTDDEGYLSHLPMTFNVNVSGLEQCATLVFVDRSIRVNLLVVDLVPPMLLLDVLDKVATNSTNFTLTGRVIDEHSGVAFLEVAILPSDYIRVPVDIGTGRFEHTIVLRKGYQSLAIRGYDSVGNRRVKVVEAFYSLSPPYIFIDDPEEGTWVNSNLTFLSGVTEAGATVELHGIITEAVNGSFRIPAYLNEGPNLLTVNVTSITGNHNSTQILVYLDTFEPSLRIFDPSPTPFYTQVPSHRIRGLVEAGAEVYINQVPVDVDEDGSFTTSQVNLNEGSTKVTIRAMDAAGNENVTEVVFILDSMPPTLVVLLNGEDATRFTGGGLLKTSADIVYITIITDEDAILMLDGEQIVLTDTEVTLDYPLEEGIQTILIGVEDPAGNSLQFDPIRVDVDWSPPTLSLDNEMPNETDEALLNLRGLTEPNCTVTVNGVRVSVDTQGAFSKNYLLNEGPNSLEMVSTDQYGQSTRLVYDVTMKAPEPEPWSDVPSLLPLMLGITITILVVEIVSLQLWWRRKNKMEKGKA